MAIKTTGLTLVLILVFVFGYTSLYAEESALRLRAEYNSLRYEMSETDAAYKEEMDKLKRENEARITALKKEFHRTRNGYITRRKAKEKKLKKDYKEKMKSLTEKEAELIDRLDPKDTNNFANVR